MLNWTTRLRAAGIHLGVSATVAAVSALLVFWLWYPWPYREISSGRELFFIVMAVDVVLGPLLTFAVFDVRKSWRHLRIDLGIIAVLQLAGLSYGLWTVFIVRPVHLVFEYSMFRVVHASEVPAELLPKALPALRAYPVLGPTALSLRPFTSPGEQFDLTMAAMQGSVLSAQPQLWQPYEAAKFEILSKAKTMPTLYARFGAQKALIDEAVRSSNKTAEGLVWLPLVGRKSFWTVLLDAQSAQPVGYVPLDSF